MLVFPLPSHYPERKDPAPYSGSGTIRQVEVDYMRASLISGRGMGYPMEVGFIHGYDL
jgi:hypothetical protein